jgi:hypothetical protein
VSAVACMGSPSSTFDRMSRSERAVFCLVTCLLTTVLVVCLGERVLAPLVYVFRYKTAVLGLPVPQTMLQARWVTVVVLVGGSAACLPLAVLSLRHRNWRIDAYRIRRLAALLATLLALLIVAAAAAWFSASSGVKNRMIRVADAYLRALSDEDGICSERVRSLECPTFDLRLSPSDSVRMAKLYYDYETTGDYVAYMRDNLWRKGTLTYEDRPYRVFVRAHGRQPNYHRDGREFSITVRMRDDASIFWSTRFNLIIYKRIATRPEVNDVLASLFDVPSQKGQLVRLGINDREQSLYYFEHRVKEEFMETEGRASWIRLGNLLNDKSLVLTGVDHDGTRDGVRSAMRSRFRGIRECLPQELAERQFPQHVREEVERRYLALNRCILAQNHEAIDSFFDLDSLASFEALRLLAGHNGHGVMPYNLLLFYDTAAGLFRPVLHRDAIMALLSERPALEKMYFPGNLGVDFAHVLSPLLARNDRIRQEKYRKVWNLISDREKMETLQARLSSVHQFHQSLKEGRPPLLDAAMDSLQIDTGTQESGPVWQTVEANSALLIKHLLKSEPAVQFSRSRNMLFCEISPRSVPALGVKSIVLRAGLNGLQADRIEVGIVSLRDGNWVAPIRHPCSVRRLDSGRVAIEPAQLPGLRMCDGLDRDLEPNARRYLLFVDMRALSDVLQTAKIEALELVNTVTGTDCRFECPDGPIEVSDTEDRILALLADEQAQCEFSAAAYARKHPSVPFVVSASRLLLTGGRVAVEQDMVLPPGVELVLEEGTDLALGPGVSVLVQGSVDVNGTAQRPVTIRQLVQGEPFGSFAAVGDGTTRARLQGLRIAGGSEDSVKGVYLSGALSLHYHSTVTIQDCHVRHATCDDGLNVKYVPAVSIVDCRFEDNAADQVDLDVCSGLVSNCIFQVSNSSDSNGDGLDVSMNEIIVASSTFVGFRDKGLSIGEASKVALVGNTFKACNLGVAVKDSSRCWLGENVFADNRRDLLSYRKKPMWGEGEVVRGSPFTPNQQ